MDSKHWVWFEYAVAVLAVGFLVSSLVMKSAGMFGIYCFLLFALFVAASYKLVDFGHPL